MNIENNFALNFQVENKSKHENRITPKSHIEQKYADRSSLDALEAQGRAFLKMPSKVPFQGAINFDVSDKEKLQTQLEEETDLKSDQISDLLKLPSDKIKEALSLYEEGIIPNARLCDAVNTPDDMKDQMLQLIRRGIKASYLIPYATEGEEGDEGKDRLKKLYDGVLTALDENPASKDVINIMVQAYVEDFSKKNVERASQVYNMIFDNPQKMLENAFGLMGLSEILEASDEKYQKFVDLVNMGADVPSAFEIADAPEDAYKRAVEYLKEGLDDVSALSKIEDENQVQKIKDLVKKYQISINDGVIISDYDEKEYQKAIKLVELGAFNMFLISLPDTAFNNLLTAIEQGGDLEKLKSELESLYGAKKLDTIIDFINSTEENNERWDNFISKSGRKEEYEKELSKEDLVFLKSHAFESEFYTPEEYIDAFLYFKNLKTPNGENILRCDSFINKISEQGLGDYAAKSEDMLYKNIEQMLSINPSSVEASYIQSIIELIEMGEVNPSAFRKLSDLNDIKSLESMLIGFNFDRKADSTNWVISNNLKRDVDLMNDVIANNTNQADFNNDYTDKYVPAYKTEEEGVKNSKIGDAFLIEGEKYIKIKTDDSKAQTVKLTKETYAKLFPPVERFLTSQQTMGNCYCIETLMSMYCNDRTRINLLSTMEENENGDITIKIGDYDPVIFKDGKLPENEPTEIYSSGADGFKLFEYAYSCALVQDKISEAQNELEGDKLLEFQEFIKSNPNNFFIYKDKGEIKWATYDDAIKDKLYEKGSMNLFGAHAYKTFNNFLLGNGGLQHDVYKKFGYSSDFYMGGMLFNNAGYSKKELIEQFKGQGIVVDNISTIEKAERILKQPDFFKHNQVQIGLGGHAYCLTQEHDSECKDVYCLYNPHNQGFPIQFDNLNDMLKKASQVTITKID